MHPRIAQRRSTIAEVKAQDLLCRQIIELLNAMEQFFERVGARDCDFAEHRDMVRQMADMPNIPTEKLIQLSDQLQAMALNIIGRVRGEMESAPNG